MVEWKILTENEINSDLNKFKQVHVPSPSQVNEVEEGDSFQFKSPFDTDFEQEGKFDENDVASLRESVGKAVQITQKFKFLNGWILARKLSLLKEIETLRKSVPQEFEKILENFSFNETISGNKIEISGDSFEEISYFPKDINLAEVNSVNTFNENMLDQLSVWTDKNEYFECLKHMSPLSLNVSDFSTPTSDGKSNNKGYDSREHQTIRDIERDQIYINDIFLSGSIGFEQILGEMQAEIERTQMGFKSAMSNSGWQKTLKSFCKLALQAVNRTESGGLSYEAIQFITKTANIAPFLIVPNSRDAEPLKMKITTSPCQNENIISSHQYSLGIACQIEATTLYTIYSDDMEETFSKLRATYYNFLSFPLSPPFPEVPESFDEIGYSNSTGKIIIEVLDF